MITLLFDLLGTIAIYSLPIIVYRYGIVKHPVEHAKARKITIIYGIIAFVVMSVLLFSLNGGGVAGGAILFWSWVNYKVLSGGKSKQTELAETNTASDAVLEELPITGDMAEEGPIDRLPVAEAAKDDYPTFDVESLQYDLDDILREMEKPSKKILFCKRCGSRLIEGSRFCSYCGSEIDLDETI